MVSKITLFTQIARYFNPFVPNASFSLPSETSENCKVFRCFKEERTSAWVTNGLNHFRAILKKTRKVFRGFFAGYI